MNIKLEGIFLLIFLVLAFLSVVIFAFWMINTEKRLKRFFVGKKAKDLEDTIFALQDDIEKLKKAKKDTEAALAIVDSKLKKSIRGLETIRFNPFPDQG